uniref:Phosphatidylethanolamine-binding protein n=1 Tax=Tetradesmus obliquus TaxID=3088 RepID=A0A383WGT2_TETOB|eukprot:jgi/Sobl393_1/4998/SZX76631.1
MAEVKDVAPTVLNTVQMSIKYGESAFKDGQHLGKAQAARAPTVEFAGAAGKRHTLIMVDPDAPSPDNPAMREWLHWIVANIPAGGDVSKGFTVTEYAGPTPPRGTHRYIFLLYEQPEGVLLPAKQHEQRAKFHSDVWAKAHQLGDPVAACFFKTAAGE